MKTLLTIILCFALVSECSAPTPPETNVTVAMIVLGITIIAVGATAVYVVLKCARKLNQTPPTIEGSTNRVDWITKGQMQADGNEFKYSEPATNGVMFYRAVR
jgi:heme/copper-type cytochrome/quinol oxidase subunit 2